MEKVYAIRVGTLAIAIVARSVRSFRREVFNKLPLVFRTDPDTFSIPNICPGVDSNALGSFWNDNYLITSASAYFTAPPASCTSLLAATGTCTAILAEQTILDNAFSFYGPGQIPAGSLTPSDRATYASPSASTVVWTWVQPSQVLTAVMSPMTAGSNPSAAPVSASAFNPNPSAVPGSSSNSPTGSGISSASITPLASFAPSGSASPSPSPSPSPSSKSAGGAGIALIGQSVIAVVVGAGVIARMALA